jgi:hypothetical protein
MKLIYLLLIGYFYSSELLANIERTNQVRVVTKKQSLANGMARYEYTIHNLSRLESIRRIEHSSACLDVFIPESIQLFPDSIEFAQGKRFPGSSPTGWSIEILTEDYSGPYGLLFKGPPLEPLKSVGGFQLTVEEDDNIWLEPEFCVIMGSGGYKVTARSFVWNMADELLTELDAETNCAKDLPDSMPDYDLVNKSEQCRKRVEIYDTRLANTRKACFRKKILENRKTNITLHENLARLLAKVNAAPTNKEIKLKYDNLKNNILLNLSSKITEKNQLIEDRKVKLNEDISKAADLCK